MAVVGLDITKRSPFADGESFGDVGSYELLEGTAHFSVDPSATLTVRKHPNMPAIQIDGGMIFVRVEDEQVESQPSHIHMADEFQPGKIYELVYQTVGSQILGLRFLYQS